MIYAFGTTLLFFVLNKFEVLNFETIFWLFMFHTYALIIQQSQKSFENFNKIYEWIELLRFPNKKNESDD